MLSSTSSGIPGSGSHVKIRSAVVWDTVGGGGGGGGLDKSVRWGSVGLGGVGDRGHVE